MTTKTDERDFIITIELIDVKDKSATLRCSYSIDNDTLSPEESFFLLEGDKVEIRYTRQVEYDDKVIKSNEFQDTIKLAGRDWISKRRVNNG